MDGKQAIWWSMCGKCSTKVEIKVPDIFTKEQVKEEFAKIGIQVLPCLCAKCLKEKEAANDTK